MALGWPIAVTAASAGCGPRPFGPVKLESHRFRLGRTFPETATPRLLRRPRPDRAVRQRLQQPAAARRGGIRGPVPMERCRGRGLRALRDPRGAGLALGSDDDDERSFRAVGDEAHSPCLLTSAASPDRPRNYASVSTRSCTSRVRSALDADWEQLKRILDLPPDLSQLHPRTDSRPTGASIPRAPGSTRAAVRHLRHRYARDYRLLEEIEDIRASRGWVPNNRWRRVTRGARRTAAHARRVARAPWKGTPAWK